MIGVAHKPSRRPTVIRVASLLSITPVVEKTKSGCPQKAPCTAPKKPAQRRGRAICTTGVRGNHIPLINIAIERVRPSKIPIPSTENINCSHPVCSNMHALNGLRTASKKCIALAIAHTTTPCNMYITLICHKARISRSNSTTG